MCLFLVSKSDMYAQQTIDFSFEKTGPNHSVLVLPTWHPVIKELELRDSLPKDFVLGFQNDSLETGDLVGIFFVFSVRSVGWLVLYIFIFFSPNVEFYYFS